MPMPAFPQIYEYLELFSAAGFFIAFYGLITSMRIIKAVVSTVIMEASVVMFILSIGFSRGAVPPIGSNLQDAAAVADPLTQAMIITAIIIGAVVTAVNLTVLITICRKYKSTDWNVVKEQNTERNGS